MTEFLFVKVFLAYAFIAGISCRVFLLDSAEGDEGVHPADVSQCRDAHGRTKSCPGGSTDCVYLKCTGGVWAGCAKLDPDVPQSIVCTDSACQDVHLGNLRRGAHVCQVCATKNCNTGKDGDGNWQLVSTALMEMEEKNGHLCYDAHCF